MTLVTDRHLTSIFTGSWYFLYVRFAEFIIALRSHTRFRALLALNIAQAATSQVRRMVLLRTDHAELFFLQTSLSILSGLLFSLVRPMPCSVCCANGFFIPQPSILMNIFLINLRSLQEADDTSLMGQNMSVVMSSANSRTPDSVLGNIGQPLDHGTKPNDDDDDDNDDDLRLDRDHCVEDIHNHTSHEAAVYVESKQPEAIFSPSPTLSRQQLAWYKIFVFFHCSRMSAD